MNAYRNSEGKTVIELEDIEARHLLYTAEDIGEVYASTSEDEDEAEFLNEIAGTLGELRMHLHKLLH